MDKQRTDMVEMLKATCGQIDKLESDAIKFKRSNQEIGLIRGTLKAGQDLIRILEKDRGGLDVMELFALAIYRNQVDKMSQTLRVLSDLPPKRQQVIS